MHDMPVYRIAHLVVEDYYPVQHTCLRHSEHAARILRDVLQDANCEKIVALLLDAENGLIGIHNVGIGPFETCIKHPRQVFLGPMLANAAAVILGHHHASGDLTPSAEDRVVTRRLMVAGRLLGIEVRDHIIVGESFQFCSLIEEGLLP